MNEKSRQKFKYLENQYLFFFEKKGSSVLIYFDGPQPGLQ